MTTKARRTFKDDIDHCVDESLRNARFRSAPSAFASEKLIVYIKPCNCDIAQYLMFRDSRAAGGDIIVDLWLAPIQIPDDRINVLGIGIKVNLFSGYDVDDEIMSCIVKKALAASEELNKLLDFAISDLRSPFIQNHRTGIYRKALMLEHVALAEPQFIAQISEVVNDFGHGRIDYDQAVSMCELILVAKGENWPEDLMAIPVSQKARLLTEISIARKLAS